jgi:ABC-type phosphate transport system substrate-binding protein
MLIALGAFVFSVPHAGAITRTLTVTPSTVRGDEGVNVSWSGFTPTATDGSGLNTVTIAQCIANPQSLADCFTSARPSAGGSDSLGTAVFDGFTAPDGTGSTLFEARSAAYLPQLDCNATTPCSIIAFENDGQVVPPDQLPATTLIAPIRFARTTADCPAALTPNVFAAGEASASAAMDSWASRLCVRNTPVSVDYTTSSSPAGKTAFFGRQVDVGVTSTRASLGQYPPPRRAFAYAPIDISSVAIAFNVDDTTTGQPITHMNLTPRLVAMLIAGQQLGGPGTDLFSDPEFLTLNPGHAWPLATHPPLLRAEANADTWILTNWLQHDTAARRFLDGNDPTAAVDPYWKGIQYPTNVFENRDPTLVGVYNPRFGTLVNARRLFNFQAPGDAVLVSPFEDGLFGIIDTVTARSFDLPTASILPDNAPAGTAFVAPNTRGLEHGLAAMQVQNGTGGRTLLANPGATGGAYPLVTVDYALVPTAHLTKRKARDITTFLNFVSGAGQGGAVLPNGYLPLTAPLREQTLAVVQQLGSG